MARTSAFESPSATDRCVKRSSVVWATTDAQKIQARRVVFDNRQRSAHMRKRANTCRGEFTIAAIVLLRNLADSRASVQLVLSLSVRERHGTSKAVSSATAVGYAGWPSTLMMRG